MAQRILGVSLPEELVRRLDDVAAARSVSRSGLIAELLEEGLGNEELQVKALTHPVVGSAMMQAMARPEVLRALLGAMREDLNDEQLLLFTKGMHAMQETMTAGKPKLAGKTTRRKVPAKKPAGKRKGGKR